MTNALQPYRSRLVDILEKYPELRIPQEKYNINVTSNSGATLSPQETIERYRNHDGAGKAAHLYFHVPFCDYVCTFCNYVKQLLPDNGKREQTLDRWTNTLIGELEIAPRGMCRKFVTSYMRPVSSQRLAKPMKCANRPSMSYWNMGINPALVVGGVYRILIRMVIFQECHATNGKGTIA